MSSYAEWKRVLERASECISEEQSEWFAAFDHAESWQLINDLIAAGLRQDLPVRKESGLVRYRQIFEAAEQKSKERGIR